MKVKRKYKKKNLLIIFVVLLVLCFPIKYRYKDGGTVSYKAISYSYTKYHRLEKDDSYYTETEFLIFPFNFLN